MVVDLELARLEEGNGVLDERHGRQLRQILIIVKLLLTAFNAALEFGDAALSLILGHQDRSESELVILQVIQLFQIVHALCMSSISALLEVSSLIDRLQDGIDFQNLVLEPHLHMNERVGHRSRQVVVVLLQLLIVGVLEEELLLR